MVDFMLEDLRHEPRPAPGEFLSFLVVRGDQRLLASLDLAVEPADGEASFFKKVAFFREPRHDRIDEHDVRRGRNFFVLTPFFFLRLAKAVGDFAGNDEYPKRVTDLGRRDSDAVFLRRERGTHLAENFPQMRRSDLGKRHVLSDLAENRIPVLNDRGHSVYFP